MKTMIKKFITLSILTCVVLGFIQVVNAQLPNDGKFQHDPASFIGKWEAKSGDNTYELTLKSGQWLLAPPDQFVDVILGELTYRTNGKITRQIKRDGDTPAFRGFLRSSPTEISFLFSDTEKNVNGNGRMIIDPENPQKATWTLGYRERLIILEPGEDPGPRAKFDIPMELEWTKIE